MLFRSIFMLLDRAMVFITKVWTPDKAMSFSFFVYQPPNPPIIMSQPNWHLAEDWENLCFGIGTPLILGLLVFGFIVIRPADCLNCVII